MDRRSFIRTAAMAAPLAVVAAPASAQLPVSLGEAFEAFEDMARASVPEGYRYGGVYCIGDAPMVVAIPKKDGEPRLNLFPRKGAEWVEVK